MKQIYFSLLILTLISCGRRSDKIVALESRKDSLERNISNMYKPGFGEFMSAIQLHHSKLWFAGQYNNWKLARFEVHEIEENLEDIRRFQAQREESRLIGMIDPLLDSIEYSIQRRNADAFQKNYSLLTNTCNQCHRKTGFEFIEVKVPDGPPIGNQNFLPGK